MFIKRFASIFMSIAILTLIFLSQTHVHTESNLSINSIVGASISLPEQSAESFIFSAIHFGHSCFCLLLESGLPSELKSAKDQCYVLLEFEYLSPYYDISKKPPIS